MPETNTLAEIGFVDTLRKAIETGLAASTPATKIHLEYIDRAFTWLEFTDEDAGDDDGDVLIGIVREVE